MKNHLAKFGLVCKDPIEIGNARVLGLQLKHNHGRLKWHRGNVVPASPDHMLSRRELFSVCGVLTGHFPVAGWLRIACSYMKRCALGQKWEDDIGDQAMNMLLETLSRVRSADPVGGVWYVENVNEAVIWCDASGLLHLGVHLRLMARL